MNVFDKNAQIKWQSRWLWNPQLTMDLPPWFSFGFPVLVVMLCSLVISDLFIPDGPRLPLVPYFAIVMLFASYGGFRASLAAAVSSLFCAFVFFTYPYYGLNLQPACYIQYGWLLSGSAFIIWLSGITRESHRQLQKKEENYRGIIEKSYEGFFTTDKNACIMYTCPSTSALLGYSEHELKQTDYYSLIDPAAADEFRHNFLKLLANSDATLKARHQLKTKSNSWIWVEVSIKNLLFDTRIRRIIYHFTDITQKVTDELRQEDFVNIASHELKNPITALNGYMHLLKSRLKDNDDVKNVTGRMEVQLRKMQFIISAMLDNTKIKAGELQFVTEPFDINGCIKEAVDAINIHTDSHQISCIFESRCRMIAGDSQKINQVITNLLTNAIKYSPDGKNVEITTELLEKDIKVKITDQGIGIAADKQPYLFQRFYRVDTLPKKISGLGLGLFIAAEIIRHHNGAIGVESKEGAGSAFWFTLPLTAKI